MNSGYGSPAPKPGPSKPDSAKPHPGRPVHQPGGGPRNPRQGGL